MRRKIKLLIVTDSTALPSGMAETTRLIFGALLKHFPDQYELHQIGLFHCYAVTTPCWPIYPTRAARRKDGGVGFAANDVYAQLTFCEVVKSVEPDVVFAFNDPQRILHLCTPPEERHYKLILYLNFDGFPIPPDHGPILSKADFILTMSEFSLRVLLCCYPQVSESKTAYLYSPADTSRFQPLANCEKRRLRNDLFPAWMPRDAFVLGWVGRNLWRKQVWVLYKVTHYLRRGAYLNCHNCGKVTIFDWDPLTQSHLYARKKILRSTPTLAADACDHCGSLETKIAEPFRDIFLWLHMPQDDPAAAWPISWIEETYGIRRGQDVHYTEGCGMKTALAPEQMPALFQLWDCLIYLSGGEGFGIPAWEAMCTGLPVVYTNYSSHAEFLNEASAGLAVGGTLQPEPKECIWRMIADIPQAIQAIRKLYLDRKLCRRLGRNGHSFVHQYTPEVQAGKLHRMIQETLTRT